MSVAAVEANSFQKYLIPEESMVVRYCMQKAGAYANRSNPFLAHFVSVGFAVAAVALSAFNTFSYALQLPFKLLFHIAQFNPYRAVFGVAEDLINTTKSLVFVTMGMTFIVAGTLFPKPIFTHFAPLYYSSLEVRLEAELKQEKAENERLKSEVDKLTKGMKTATSRIQTLENQGPNRKSLFRRIIWPFS